MGSWRIKMACPGVLHAALDKKETLHVNVDVKRRRGRVVSIYEPETCNLHLIVIIVQV